MPCTRTKIKKQLTKRTIKETVKQKKRMQERLMVISLKVDDYIYKKKPISIQEADVYRREIEEFRNQCQDESYIQVIERLTKYMKCIIREKSPKDIVYVSMLSPIGNSVEEINNKNEQVQDAATPLYNAITDKEMWRSLSNLSIEDHKDPLAISASNDNDTYQRKANVDPSASAIIKENLNEVRNQRVAFTNKESDVCNLNDSNEQSQNILSNFQYENYNSLSNLRTFRNTKIYENKQIQQNLEKVTDNIINYVETNVENNTNKSEINNVNDEKDKTLVDDSSEQSQNLLNNVNYSSAWALQNNTNYGKEIANNIAIITSNSNMNTGNKRTRLEEVLNLKAIKQKELGCDSNKLSQKILNHFDYGNHTVASVQPLYNKIPDNIIDARYNVINFNNANTGNSNTTSKFSYLNVIQQKEKELGGESNKLSQNLRNLENKTNVVVGILKNNTNVKNYQTQQIPETHYSNNNVKFSKSNQTQHSTFSDLNVIQLKEKELGGESNKLSQNLRNLENKTNEVVGILKNNTNVKNYQTQQIPEIHGSNNVKFSVSDQTQHNTFMPPKSYKVQDNTIFKSNIQNIIEPLEPPKKVQRKMANDSSQNQENAIGKVKRRRRKLNKDIVETTKKRTYNRKNKDNAVTARNDLSKEETVHSSVQDAKNPGNSVKNSIQEKQRTISKNKRDEMDISWVENMKFVRAITTDEYFKFDNLEESFWTDLSLPSDMSLTDFEYDNINIWKN